MKKSIREELIRSVNDTANTTDSSHIPIGKFIDEKGNTYLFAYLCQKKELQKEQKKLF